MFVTERYKLPESIVKHLRLRTPNFGFNGYGETVFYTRYSRTKLDGSQESWSDVVTRCVEGIFSIRKDWYRKTHIAWEQSYWDDYAYDFANFLFDMKFLPPGRGLWAMGTEFVYERGSMALQNCGFTLVGDKIWEDAHWCMDALMCGVGVGFLPERNDDIEVFKPKGSMVFRIPDTREGWCDSVGVLIKSYMQPGQLNVDFDYTDIRPQGLPIKGFGGISSGPEPLIELHKTIRVFFERYSQERDYDSVLLKADIINSIGCAVIAGNVRRSAEICCGYIDDPVFLDLKNYTRFPYRENIGWRSNNSAILERPEDYLRLSDIAKRVVINGEPGVINRLNLVKGRIGKDDNVRRDNALGFNPCGEQPLENKELCCLVESVPNRCVDVNGDFSEEMWNRALEYATFYASTVTLLPTHRPETNRVMAKNRRIGVSIMGYTPWVAREQQYNVINYLRNGYSTVRRFNSAFNAEAGIPESIRVTTVKPGGTTPKLAGEIPGMGYKNFTHMIRRHRQAKNSSLSDALIAAGVPYEDDVVSANTLVFEFPLYVADGKEASEASLWEQAQHLMTLQKEWSDNAVSNTLNFKPAWPMVERVGCADEAAVEEALTKLSKKYLVDFSQGVRYNENYEFNNHRCSVVKKWEKYEVQVFKFDPNHEEGDVETVLSNTVPHIKSLALLPHSSMGVYAQMPEEGIAKEEYERRLAQIKPIDWSTVRFNVAQPEVFCTAESCELPK